MIQKTVGMTPQRPYATHPTAGQGEGEDMVQTTTASVEAGS